MSEINQNSTNFMNKIREKILQDNKKLLEFLNIANERLEAVMDKSDEQK